MPNCQEFLHRRAELAEDASLSTKHMITTPALPGRCGEPNVSYYFSAVLAYPSLTMSPSLTSAEAQPSLQNFKRSSRTSAELYPSSHMRQSG
jgi:hypothetical protein